MKLENDSDALDLQCVRRIMEAKGIRLDCEVCGRPDDWTVPRATADDPSTMTIGLVVKRGAIAPLNIRTVDTIPMICGNCGHVRLFLKEYLVGES